MGKKRNIREDLLTALELTGDVGNGDPIVTITGQTKAVIENYRSILTYTGEELIVLTVKGKVIFRGKHLEILSYNDMEMEIKGKITELLLE